MTALPWVPDEEADAASAPPVATLFDGSDDGQADGGGSLPSEQEGADPGPRTPAPRTGTAGSARPLRPAPSTGPDAYEALRREMLDQIQHRNAEATDPVAVEALARRVIDEYQIRARSGFGGRPLARPEEMVRRLCRSILAWGPLTPFLEGEIAFEELMIHGSDVSYIDDHGRLAALDEPVTEAELRSVVERLLATAGVSVDESRPMVQAQVLGGRARIGVVIPPVADALDVTLRWYVLRKETLEELIAWDSLTPSAAGLLAAATRTPSGLVVTGEPGSGKTSLANAILRAAPPVLRLVCCEDTPELQVDHLNASRWKTRPAAPDGTNEIALRDLVRMALGMRPDLIAVGEVRGAEAYELTRAGNAGCGLLTTLHANSARQGLQALMSTAIMAGQNVPADQVRTVFTSVVDLVVHLAREPLELLRSGGGRIRRQVMEIVAIPPLQGSETDFTVEPIFVREEFGAPLRWTGSPLPDDLRTRLDRALRPHSISVQGILEGREELLP